MDLKKMTCGEYQSSFFSSTGDQVDHKTCELLGYKEGIPVLGNTPGIAANKPTNTSINKGNRPTLRVEVNAKTGEKFIKLNGKKLKMVAEPKLTTQFLRKAQVIKATPGNTYNDRKQLKIKIIGSMPSIIYNSSKLAKIDTVPSTDSNAANRCVNKADKDVDIVHTTTVVNTIGTKIPSSTKVIIGSSAAGSHSTANGLNIAPTGVSCDREDDKCDGLLKSPGGVSKMNPLDLSKVSQAECAKVAVKRVDSGVQAKVQTVDKTVQTEEEDDLLLNILNLDFCDYLSSNTPVASVAEKAMPVKTLPAVPSPAPVKAHSDKFRMFFQDLRNAMVPDVNGNRPIHVGVLSNDAVFVKRSCSVLRALQTSVDIVNHGDFTALQLAILNNANILIVKMLLAYGASLEVVDAEGNNIIHLAIECKRTDVLDMLLRFADERKFNLDDFNAEGLTPLMMCCCNDLVQCADLLLKFDADVNIRDRKSGRTALFHAAENSNYDMVQLLLSYNADTKIKNFFGTSPHDAMYEVDEIPDNIKSAILGKSSKRKMADEPKPPKVRKVDENTNKLKTYSRLKKIEGYGFPPNFAATAK